MNFLLYLKIWGKKIIEKGKLENNLNQVFASREKNVTFIFGYNIVSFCNAKGRVIRRKGIEFGIEKNCSGMDS